jgi:hypothetical protein
VWGVLGLWGGRHVAATLLSQSKLWIQNGRRTLQGVEGLPECWREAASSRSLLGIQFSTSRGAKALGRGVYNGRPLTYF